MRLETLLPDSLRSRYSLKLLCVSLGIVLVITAITATTVVDISDRVQTEQLNAIETNAELEARALGQWIDGKQQTVRVLSNHQGIVPANRSRTQSTLDGEMRQLSNETASLSIVERSPASFSNGTRETIIASTERELVGAPLRATDINWKPTVGFNFDGTDDVILSWVYTDNTNRTFVALASPTPGRRARPRRRVPDEHPRRTVHQCCGRDGDAGPRRVHRVCPLRSKRLQWHRPVRG
ncbi:MAG: hypothetical protein J07HN4v3_00667 [Halonotius sp. J07HN4]|nr:MAG: hypothetical protein J07HN4v3_00667 [Halonotius sp. J07HN4]